MTFSLPTTKKRTWRYVSPKILGEIIGLPNSRGFLVATNDILCLIERLDGSTFEGHLGWFEKDKKEKGNVQKMNKTRGKPIPNDLRNLLEGWI